MLVVRVSGVRRILVHVFPDDRVGELDVEVLLARTDDLVFGSPVDTGSTGGRCRKRGGAIISGELGAHLALPLPLRGLSKYMRKSCARGRLVRGEGEGRGLRDAPHGHAMRSRICPL